MTILYAICSPDDVESEGDLFYGTLEQFCDCFCTVYTPEQLRGASYLMFKDCRVVEKPILTLVK